MKRFTRIQALCTPLTSIREALISGLGIKIKSRIQARIKQGLRWMFQASIGVNVLMLLFVVLAPASKEVKILRDCIAPHSVGRSTTVFVFSAGNAFGELALPFYNDRGIRYVEVSDEQDLMAKIADVADQAPAISEKQFLYASRKNRETQLQENKIPAELLCQAVPEWVVKNFNFGDWRSRASLWQVWQINQGALGKSSIGERSTVPLM